MLCRQLLRAAIVLTVTALAACGDVTSPESEKLSALDAAPLRNIVVNGPEDVPLEDDMEMPPEFYTTASIVQPFIDIGFVPDIAWATASMRFYSTYGKIVLHLKLKKGDVVVDRDSSPVFQSHFLPGFYDLSTRVNISTAADCGYRVDGKAEFSVYMSFPIPRAGTLFTWGHNGDSRMDGTEQPPCPTTFVGSGGGPSSEWLDELLGDDSFGDDDDFSDDAYRGECRQCQLWYATRDGIVTEYWWECESVDDSLCEDEYYER